MPLFNAHYKSAFVSPKIHITLFPNIFGNIQIMYYNLIATIIILPKIDAHSLLAANNGNANTQTG